jgi:hypothetical protein
MLVIDEQKDLAVGFSNIYHDSKLKTMKLKGIPGLESVPSYPPGQLRYKCRFQKSQRFDVFANPFSSLHCGFPV